MSGNAQRPKSQAPKLRSKIVNSTVKCTLLEKQFWCNAGSSRDGDLNTEPKVTTHLEMTPRDGFLPKPECYKVSGAFRIEHEQDHRYKQNPSAGPPDTCIIYHYLDSTFSLTSHLSSCE